MKSVRFCEKSWISWNWLRELPKCLKLEKAKWLPVINMIFELPSCLDPFSQINVLSERHLGHLNCRVLDRKGDLISYRKQYG